MLLMSLNLIYLWFLFIYMLTLSFSIHCLPYITLQQMKAFTWIISWNPANKTNRSLPSLGGKEVRKAILSFHDYRRLSFRKGGKSNSWEVLVVSCLFSYKVSNCFDDPSILRIKCVITPANCGANQWNVLHSLRNERNASLISESFLFFIAPAAL